MFKFLIIVALIVYVIYKIGGLFFRAGAASQQLRNEQQRRYDAMNANANAKKKKDDTKRGEYIDYEEVK